MPNPPSPINPNSPGNPSSTNPSNPVKFVAKIQESSFRGPLPPPDLLQQYETIHPGFADRIIRMTEGEIMHRRELETRELESDIEARKLYFRQIRRGQIFGFFIGIFAITAGTIATVLGHPLVGGFFGTFGVASLVSAFLYERHQSTKQPTKDSEQPK